MNAEPNHTRANPSATGTLHRHAAQGHAALDEALKALDAAELRRRPVDMTQALALVGRCYRDLDEAETAAWYLHQALAWARTLGGVDSSVDLLCDLAELSVAISKTVVDDDGRKAHAERDRARDQGFEATELVRQCSDPRWEVTVLLRVSDMLNSCGDHDDATALQCRAMDLMTHRSPAAPAHAATPRRAM
jgi:hypothetical protein